MGDAKLFQLPSGQQSLIARSGFRNPDMNVEPGVSRRVNRGQRRAVVDGRQPAGVAVGHQIQAGSLFRQRAQVVQPVFTNAPALFGVFFRDAGGFLPGRRSALRDGQGMQQGLHACQCPVQIDCRRAGRAQLRDHLVQCVIAGILVQRHG